MRGKALWAVAIGAMLGSAAIADAKPAGVEETRAIMHELVGAIRLLLPLSVDDDGFRAPKNAARVRSALRTLNKHAEVLRTHGADNPAFGFLGDSLAAESREVLLRYQRGQYEAASFLLQDLTEYCVTCHARLPAPDAAKLASQLIDDATLGKMPKEDRARLLIATRQFDAARKTYESLLFDEKVHAPRLIAPLVDYLTMTVRVKSDHATARATLERFAKRKDLWLNLQSDLESWMTQLKELEPYSKKPPSLEDGRALVNQGKTLNRYPADKRALIHNIVASSVLHRLVEGKPVKKGDVKAAEAYYLLGLTEANIRESYWVSHAEFYLETAIRVAPASDIAEDAYAVLEQEVVLAYAGTSGVHIPKEVTRRLDELRALINTSTRKAKKGAK